MEFITTGQRLAVENFSYGTIYKVKFLDDTEAYMMCSGIGSNLIMLMSSEPRLFALTIDSASLIDTIDIHDPTPPQPPTPIENALQYQTGEPPFTFTTTGNKLFSWYIEGACGEKTANLLPPPTAAASGEISGVTYNITADGVCTFSGTATATVSITVELSSSFVIPISVSSGGNGTLALNNNKAVNAFVRLYNDNTLVDDWGLTVINRISTGYASMGGKTITKYVIQITNGVNTDDLSFAVAFSDNGVPVSPFEPYGYKIPIFCNTHNVTIYLDEPLAEGEKLYSVNTNTEIITDIGENTLTVDTTETPTMQIVYKIYAERG